MRIIPYEKGPFRILSMDGAGIYGLAQALILKRLCEKDKRFLEPGSVQMFAGTSAGGVNSLFLASYERPRDAVENGCMIEFWKSALTYAPPLDPVDQVTSLMGQSGWFGAFGYFASLKRYFGDRTLGDLKHKVLISTYNWYGSEAIPPKYRRWKPKFFYNFPACEPDRSARIVDVAYGAGTPPGFRRVFNGITDGGVFVPNPAMNSVAKAVAYQQSLLPAILVAINEAFSKIALMQWHYFHQVEYYTESNWLPLVELLRFLLLRERVELQSIDTEDFPPLGPGINALIDEGDALLAALPTTGPVSPEAFMDVHRQLNTLVIAQIQLVDTIFGDINGDPTFQASLNQLTVELQAINDNTNIDSPNDMGKLVGVVQAQFIAIFKVIAPTTGDSLRGFAVLSISAACKSPFYWLKNFNYGLGNFSSTPTNPPMLNFYSPFTFLGLDAPSENVDYQCMQLIKHSFYRLDPPLFGPPWSFPAMQATLLARFCFWREAILKQIETTFEYSPVAETYCNQAVKFLESPAWYLGY